MGKFIPVFVACVQYLFGIYIFKKPVLNGCGPLMSCVIVMFSLFLLLWSLPLYPQSLRKLWSIMNYVAQYLIAVFLIEHIMGNFWFPLEIAILAGLPKIAFYLEDYINQDYVCNFFRWDITGVGFSYLLSVVLLVASLHATRFIDLRLLEKGIGPFVADAIRRPKKFFKKLYTTYGVSFNLKKDKDCPVGDSEGFDIIEEPPDDNCYFYN